MRLIGARFLFLFLASSSIALGCGGEVIIPSQSSNATSGNGGAAGSATASGAGGTMGSAGGTMGVGGSFVSSTSTGIQPATCDGALSFVDILGDGPDQHFDASCAPTAELILAGGPPSPPPGPPQPPQKGTLVINACPPAPVSSLVISGFSDTWPASVTKLDITYSHDGAEYHGSAGGGSQLDVLTFEAVGGVVTGTFTATVIPVDPAGIPAKIQITGKFRVCRGPDYVPV
jgi:hypothetical protein